MSNFRKEVGIQQSIWNNKNGHKYYRGKHLNHNPEYSAKSCVECRAIQDIEEYYQKCKKNLYFTNSGLPIFFPTRKANDISRYFAYRVLSIEGQINKRVCIDHGIAGGLLFFDRIIRNYAEAYHSALYRNPDTNLSNFINPSDYSNKPMRFSYDQLPLFAYIADCIINHNIWCERKDTDYGKIYKKMGMEKLLMPGNTRVNFFTNPLLFILAVSDSLEPYKLFSRKHIDAIKYNEQSLFSIINNTIIDVKSDRIIVKPPKNMEDKLQEKLNELQDWVDVECIKNRDSFEIIPLKQLSL